VVLDWAAYLATLSTHTGLETLAGASAVGAENGSIKSIEAVDRIVALQEQATALQELKSAESMLFWLLPQDHAGKPIVVLGKDKKNIAAAAKRWSVGQHKTGVRGKVTRAADGRLEFSAKSDTKDILTPLATCAQIFLCAFPALQTLNNSRYLRLGEKGQILHTLQNESLWT